VIWGKLGLEEKKMHRERLLIAFLVMTILVVGCQRKAPPTAQALPPTNTPQATAIPVTPTAVFVVSTPASGKGNVTGLIIRQPRGLPPEPIMETKLFLAKLMTDQEGKTVALAGLDESSAPFCFTTASGQFLFTNVEPGIYALIIRTPLFPALAHDIVTDKDIVPTIVADQIVDLGEIRTEIEY
jgi:hypothetical protein